MKLWLFLGFAALAVPAVGCVLLGLRRPGGIDNAEHDERLAQNTRAYRQRVSELEADLAAGRIDQAAFEAQEADAAAALLLADEAVAAGGRGAAARSETRLGGWPMIAAASVSVPIVAVALYLSGGGLPPLTQQETADALLEQLEDRLADNPADLESWVVLGRSRMMMQRYGDAAEAFSQANRLTDNRAPELLVAEGEALAFARNDDLQGRPDTLFRRALEAGPNHPRALWYSALAAMQRSSDDEAAGYLRRLRQQDLPPELAAAVDQQLAALGSAGGGTQAAAQPSPEATGRTMRVELSLADGLSAPQGAVLFVFARNPSGPPLPLAVQRISDYRFPLQVTLSESDAMMPGMSLASADEYLLVARVSRAGDVTAASGDLQGQRGVVASELDAPIALVIDTVVP